MTTSSDIMAAIRQYAWIAGAERPDQAWIDHPAFADSWTANPHYIGPPIPHPMSDFDSAESPEEYAAGDSIYHEPPETGAEDADWSDDWSEK